MGETLRAVNRISFNYRGITGKINADFFGDHGRRRQGHRHIARLGAAFLHQPPDGLGHLIKFFDIAVGDPTALQGLHGTALQNQIADLVQTQFNQLDTGRANVKPKQGRWLTAEKRPQ